MLFRIPVTGLSLYTPPPQSSPPPGRRETPKIRVTVGFLLRSVDRLPLSSRLRSLRSSVTARCAPQLKVFADRRRDDMPRAQKGKNTHNKCGSSRHNLITSGLKAVSRQLRWVIDIKFYTTRLFTYSIHLVVD